ncbi:hypothetical protein T01_9078 [Trichinella spiralis]|uniref:Uncharacterized protein n=1 Tax=Trichinella spiralis TaxID=6334 RepID=A0A0V1B2H5_TRISP|nr:hypothetical protein T01_9078 [Trichinella spiralis]
MLEEEEEKGSILQVERKNDDATIHKVTTSQPQPHLMFAGRYTRDQCHVTVVIGHDQLTTVGEHWNRVAYVGFVEVGSLSTAPFRPSYIDGYSWDVDQCCPSAVGLDVSKLCDVRQSLQTQQLSVWVMRERGKKRNPAVCKPLLLLLLCGVVKKFSPKDRGVSLSMGTLGNEGCAVPIG